MNADVKILAHHLLNRGFDQLSKAEQRVLTRLAKRIHISRDTESEFDQQLTFGERLADKVAAVGGSWSFIIGFALFLIFWAVINTVVLTAGAFDPYPFIFLNLILSMIAAIQAPIIMMSQNRQAEKDRIAAQHDYEVNLKAELEIIGLHEKLDELRDKKLREYFEAQAAELADIRKLIASG